ncbi:MAG TPA: capsule assembly Wzi family protein [Candidatus Eisenbacteria bacterium]
MRIAAGPATTLLFLVFHLVGAPRASHAQADSTDAPRTLDISPAAPDAVPPPPKPILSGTVPADDDIYRDLERLDALGLIPASVLGQRPLSRAEIARILRQASNNPRAAREPVRRLLIRLRKEYPWQEGVEPRGVDEVRYGAAWLEDEPVRFLRDNGVGQLDALNQPLTSDHNGRYYRSNGGTGWLLTRHTLPFRTNLVAVLAPEFLVRFGNYDQGNVPNADSTDTRESDVQGDFTFRSIYGRLGIGPAIVQVGRDPLAWGPSPSGSLLLSTNARPLDMAYLTTDSPFRLPWFFRGLGPSRWFIGMAALGQDRVLPGSALALLRASFRVHRNIELGFSESLVMLGDDSPTDDFWQYLWEFFPAGRLGTDSDLADHRFGFDSRWHIWPGHLSLYGEILVEDVRANHYQDVTARRLGVYLPAIGPGGQWEARGEFLRLPAILYRHGRWTTGYALNGHLLGNEIGPDSRGLRFRFEKTGNEGQRTLLEFAWESRDSDIWAQEVAENGDNEDIYRAVDRPSEMRWRSRLGFNWPLTPHVKCLPNFAVERVTRAEGEMGNDRTDFMVELAFRYAFER